MANCMEEGKRITTKYTKGKGNPLLTSPIFEVKMGEGKAHETL